MTSLDAKSVDPPADFENADQRSSSSSPIPITRGFER
jgi:hypothetical protein